MAAASSRVIHQIWLGTNPRPNEWMQTVRDFAADHGYEYQLWTEKNVEGLDLRAVPGLRAEYGKLRSQLAGQADIIRLAALYKYGGVYIDADTVIMKPAKFAAFLEKSAADGVGVFFAWENLSKARTRKLGLKDRRLVANGIIGAATAGHPFLGELLEGVVANARREAGEEAWRRVGPLYVTRMYKKLRGKYPDVHIYPMRYFYPIHWGGITDPELHKKVQIPKESMLFQYGYTTNKFDKIFAERRRRATRRRRQREA